MAPAFISDSDLQKILADVKKELDVTEDAEIMKTLIDCFVNVSTWKPKIFEPHFQVGFFTWHTLFILHHMLTLCQFGFTQLAKIPKQLC